MMFYLSRIDHVTQFLFSFVSQDCFLPFYKRVLFCYSLATILTEMQTLISIPFHIYFSKFHRFCIQVLITFILNILHTGRGEI